MKKQLFAAALGCAMAGSIGLAVPAMSQSIPTDLPLRVSPTTVAPGGNVHVTPEAPCPAGSSEVHWSLGPGSMSGSAQVASTMGGWDINFRAPSAPGNYPLFVSCKAPGSPNDTAQYKQGQFTVQAGAAQPRGGRPRHTG